MNFDLKINKLQAKLDMWRSQDLTLFGKTTIIKTLGVSSLIYSASNINVPNDIAGNIKRRLFSFMWKNKRDKIKKEGLYQDYDNGGLGMTDIETMIEALRLAWIPRLLKNGQSNWKFASDHFLKSYGGLRFLLPCNCHVKDFENMPLFYKDILLYFHELKTLYAILESSYFERRSFTPQFLAKHSLRQSLSLLIRHMLRPMPSLEHKLERS